MMSASPKNLMTPEEYLKFERESEIKHEYFEGRVNTGFWRISAAAMTLSTCAQLIVRWRCEMCVKR